MSKFEEYLEAVKLNIYNELFNINTSKIKMKKIIEKYNYNFTNIFLSLFAKNKIEQVFSLDEEARSIENLDTLKEKLLEFVYKNSMRTRLYRMVIKQMFGSKVFIKEKENRLFFSLKEIK